MTSRGVHSFVNLKIWPRNKKNSTTQDLRKDVVKQFRQAEECYVVYLCLVSKVKLLSLSMLQAHCHRAFDLSQRSSHACLSLN